MNQRVGTCSLCGGDVMGFRGAYWSIIPPGPDECSSCGAVAGGDVIPMTPRPARHHRTYTSTGTSYEPA
jgi:hypothetical protein